MPDTTQPRRALVVRGGWEGHQPVEATDLFLPFLREQGFEIRVEDSPEVYADAEAMSGLDVIVQSVTMSEASPAAIGGLRAAVAGGTGFTGWHGGIADSFRASSDYLQLVGGQFATHPAVAEGSDDDFRRHRIEFTAIEHPITAGLDDIELVTEQYWVLHDDLNDVLATTTHPAEPWQEWHRPLTSPAVWTRDWGRGRIAVSTPGHSVEVLQHPTVRALVERGILWVSRLL